MTGFDMSETIAPRSDQQNFDDYATGPRLVTITEVKAGSEEQPVELHLAEYPGRPFKPSKSMRRVLVAAWGPNASEYTGRRMELVGDPTVRFGGAVVGGVRIARLSHIAKQLSLSLTVTRGKRAPYVVQPLVDAVAAPAPKPVNPDAITADKVTELGAAMTNGLELADRDQKLTWLTQQLERPIKSPTELTKAEGERLLELIRTWTEPPADEPEPTLPEVTA